MNINNWKQTVRNPGMLERRRFVSIRNNNVDSIRPQVRCLKQSCKYSDILINVEQFQERACQCRRGCHSQQLVRKRAEFLKIFRSLYCNTQTPVITFFFAIGILHILKVKKENMLFISHVSGLKLLLKPKLRTHQILFKDLTTLKEGIWKDLKLQKDCRSKFQVTADASTALRLRKSHSVIQPWSTSPIFNRKKTSTCYMKYIISCLPSMYNIALPIKKNLKDMCE